MSETKLNDALVSLVLSAGPDVMNVSGAGTTVQSYLAGVGSKKPLSSTARTRSVCWPSVNSMARWSTIGCPGTIGPSSQPSKRPKSSEHSYSAGSVELNRNAAVVLGVVAGGPDTIVVSGRPASTVHDHSSGDRSTTPSGVTARASSRCSPSVRFVSSYGFEHAANGPRSSAHSKVEPPTLEEKTKFAVLPLSSPSGPMSMNVSGASTMVKYHRAGVVSAFTTISFGSWMTARTRKMCWPRARPEYRAGDSHS